MGHKRLQGEAKEDEGTRAHRLHSRARVSWRVWMGFEEWSCKRCKLSFRKADDVGRKGGADCRSVVAQSCRRSVASALAMLPLLLACCVAGAGASQDVLYQITDEQYYEFPPLFHLDPYKECLWRRGTYCMGSFELSAAAHHQLFHTMQRYSNNWVDNFNHTRLHRGVCVSERCPHPPHPPELPDSPEKYATWFASCVNASTMSAYNLSAHLYELKYCQTGPEEQKPLSTSERFFAGFVAALLALSAVCTVLDLTLPDHARKGASWAVSWSLRGCWRALQAPPPACAHADLRAFDGLRVLCMLCVIIEHVCWITTQTYLTDTRRYELTRRAPDAMAMANSTLMVQVFFLMSSFLLAHKLLLQRARGREEGAIYTFFHTMLNRIIRISPSYFVVVWFAASWWERLDSGPMWSPLVREEAAICRRKWWMQLLYLNNVLEADDKCFVQTWYLAADMQLYSLGLALTLGLRALSTRGALGVLGVLQAASVALVAALAYHLHLVPNFVMHRPESVRVTYREESSFNVLYQSPLGNAPGALAGLLLAHLHHALHAARASLSDSKVFRWVSIAAVPLAVWWVVSSPLLLGRSGGPRWAAAALAALERPVFATFVSLALLGAMHRIPSPVARVLSWQGWSVWARLSFGALLLHMPINKSLVAARLAPSQLDRQSAILEWFGVASVSYLAALPLALLVELPFQRLHKALQRTQPPAPPAQQKTDL